MTTTQERNGRDLMPNKACDELDGLPKEIARARCSLPKDQSQKDIEPETNATIVATKATNAPRTERRNTQPADHEGEERPQTLMLEAGSEHPIETFSQRDPSSQRPLRLNTGGVLADARCPTLFGRLFMRNERKEIRKPILKDLFLLAADKGRQPTEKELEQYITSSDTWKTLQSPVLRRYFVYKVLQYAGKIEDAITAALEKRLEVARFAHKVPGIGVPPNNAVFVVPSFDLEGCGRQVEVYLTTSQLTSSEREAIRKASGDRYSTFDDGVIGKGGQGVVIVAQNLRTKQWMALKHTTHIKREEDVEHLNQVLREVNKLSCERVGLLKTEAATHAYRFRGEENGVICHLKVSPIMADFCLYSAYSRLGRVDRLAFLEAIADSVRQLHSTRIAHLDLKPDNILLSKSQNPEDADKFWPVIADFGLSTESEMLPRPAGTPGWAPDYQRSRSSHKHHKSKPCDIYSLGLIFRVLMEYAGDTMTREWKRILKKMCNEQDEARRPSIEEVCKFLSLEKERCKNQE